MNFNEFEEILLSNNIYNILKQKQNELFELIPELKECDGFNQNNKWHIYDVFEHILHVVMEVDNNKCLRLAALFHDIGKPFTYTEDENLVGHFYNHWNKSMEIFKKYQDEFNLTNEEKKLITNLIYYHDLNTKIINQEQLNELINNLGFDNINLLFSLKRADLLAQSQEFHKLIDLIDSEEQRLIKLNKF